MKDIKKKRFDFYLRALKGLSNIYINVGQYNDSMKIEKQIESIYIDESDKQHAWLQQALIYELTSRFDEAKEKLTQIITDTPHSLLAVKALGKLCWINRLQGDFNTAATYGDQGIAIVANLREADSDSEDLLKTEASLLSSIAAIYWNKGEFQNAIDFYSRAIYLHKKTTDINFLGTLYSNIGAVYLHMGNSDKAESLFIKQMKFSQKTGNKLGMAMAANNLGVVYIQKNDLDKAVTLNRKALKLAYELGDEFGIESVSINLGSIYLIKACYDNAEKMFFDALAISEKIDDKHTRASSYMYIGEFYLETDVMNKAGRYLRKAWSDFGSIGDRTYLCATAGLLAEYGIKKLSRGKTNRKKNIDEIKKFIEKKRRYASELGAEHEKIHADLLEALLWGKTKTRSVKEIRERFEECSYKYKKMNMLPDLGKAYFNYCEFLFLSGESAMDIYKMCERVLKKGKNIHYLSKLKRSKEEHEA